MNNLFNNKIDRLKTNSYKWDKTEQLFGEKDLLAMWVADMDFKAPEQVIKAFEKRLNHGIFGYTFIPDSAFDAITNWTSKRYNWKINKNLLSFSEGVVPAISTIINSFTAPGDKILIQTPVYGPFYEMIEKNDRIVLKNELIIDENKYKIDFVDFENNLKAGAKLFIFCNPHNPGSRVWTKDELQKIGELCLKYDCLILSDDIHADLVFKPNKYIPIATVDETFKSNVITCISPSKTFNLAGLNAAIVIFEDESLKLQYDLTNRKQGFFSLGTFGIIGIETAYSEGEQWLTDLLTYLEENIALTKQFLEEHLPKVKLFEAEGTYLLWLDCRMLNLTDDEIRERLLKKGKLALEPGQKYGKEGEGFVRMNIACPRELLIDGLNRLKVALQ